MRLTQGKIYKTLSVLISSPDVRYFDFLSFPFGGFLTFGAASFRREFSELYSISQFVYFLFKFAYLNSLSR